MNIDLLELILDNRREELALLWQCEPLAMNGPIFIEHYTNLLTGDTSVIRSSFGGEE